MRRVHPLNQATGFSS